MGSMPMRFLERMLHSHQPLITAALEIASQYPERNSDRKWRRFEWSPGLEIAVSNQEDLLWVAIDLFEKHPEDWRDYEDELFREVDHAFEQWLGPMIELLGEPLFQGNFETPGFPSNHEDLEHLAVWKHGALRVELEGHSNMDDDCIPWGVAINVFAGLTLK